MIPSHACKSRAARPSRTGGQQDLEESSIGCAHGCGSPQHLAQRIASRRSCRDGIYAREDALKLFLGQLLDERVLVGELAIDGSHAHARLVGDVVERGIDATLGENSSCDFENLLSIALSVSAQGCRRRGRTLVTGPTHGSILGQTAH